MMNADPLKIDTLQKQLLELLVTNREDLASHYLRVLRESLFLNRAEVRPSQVTGRTTLSNWPG
jgi:hypothetical protein